MVKKSILLFALFLILISLSFVSASPLDFNFTGNVYDVDGNALNNTLINITVWTMGAPPTCIGSNFTYSNESGGFNLTVSGNSSWFYKPVITHENSTTNFIDYIGQSLPQFPYAAFTNPFVINFYLREAGTINITAINRTGGRTNFMYQIKDTKLGYPIADNFGSYVSEANIYVPRDRNYSVMVYPNQSLPVSFDWNNFSSDSSYEFGQEYPNTNLSSYNVTTHTVHKQFNCTETLVRITGYIQNSSGGVLFDGWDEFTVVPFLLEPGNMVYLSNDVGMPYNMSAWLSNDTGPDPQTDEYNLTSGWYNITLPGPAESASYILFATARNGTSYYGSFRNITLGYSSSSAELNFTMYGLISSDWGTANSNITLKEATNWAGINISTAKQAFNLVNASNITLENIDAHLEITVDYSDYGAKEFTFMNDLSNENGTFYIPLINATGVKEINIFTMSGPQGTNDTYAPRRTSMTVSEINANNNITMFPFKREGGIDPGDTISQSDLRLFVYQSNSTCSIPYPQKISGDPCLLTGNVTMDIFNPLPAIIGGGKTDFSKKMVSTGIEVKYINVDWLASGPPAADFDPAKDESGISEATDTFNGVMKFISDGPTIYDYVLVGMPYTPGSTSQTGLNEGTNVNMSITTFYNDKQQIIWNTATNGTNGTALAGNYSHYLAHKTAWETLMGNNTCTTTTITDASQINVTNPCYIDTTENLIWIRIPHFDGNKVSITGDLITATDDGTPTDGGGTTTTFWTSTINVNEEQFIEGYTRELKVKHRFKIKINNTYHYAGVVALTATTATINVTSASQQATLSVGDEEKFDVTNDTYYDISVKLNSIANDKANITIKSIYEEIPAPTVCTPDWNCTDWSDCINETKTRTCTDSNNCGTDTGKPAESKTCGIAAIKEKGSIITIIVIIIVIVIAIVAYILYKKKRYSKKGY